LLSIARKMRFINRVSFFRYYKFLISHTVYIILYIKCSTVLISWREKEVKGLVLAWTGIFSDSSHLDSFSWNTSNTLHIKTKVFDEIKSHTRAGEMIGRHEFRGQCLFSDDALWDAIACHVGAFIIAHKEKAKSSNCKKQWHNWQ